MNKATKKCELSPIGHVQKTKNGFTLEIQEPFRPALKQLDHFSHVIVIWWANKHDNPESRSKTQCTPPYADKLTGVFACRAEYRPNPLAITTCKILEVNEQKGTVEVPWIDAHNGTPIIDLKAYFPVCDRVKQPHIPDWLKGWPEWMPEGIDAETDS
jgi:tRNA-Thr(GGU) m(6)t(6)A37 methyltransferase TsaA